MDEHKLAELFRGAVPEAPPASFDETDVASASARATARRRSTIVLAAAACAAVLAGGLVVGVKFIDQNAARTSAASGGLSDKANVPREAPSQLQVQPPAPGNSTAGRGINTEGDPFAAAVAGELSLASNAPQTQVQATYPAGSKAVAFEATEGTARGVVTAILVSPANVNAPGPTTKRQQGTTAASARTRGGGKIYVFSEPAAGSDAVPFANSLVSIAAHLAERF